jgi:hypothetical protein
VKQRKTRALSITRIYKLDVEVVLKVLATLLARDPKEKAIGMPEQHSLDAAIQETEEQTLTPLKGATT